MKHISRAIAFFLVSSFTLFGTSCEKIPDIVSYYVNQSGDLIAVDENGSEKNLGEVDIADGYFGDQVQTIEINEDGYYVINGIVTDILAVDIFTVSFMTNSDATVESQKIKDGYKVIKPDIPDKLGYTLDGWYFNDEKWVFNSDIVRSNMMLEAQWIANEYQISFISDGGTSFNTMKVIYDQEVELPIPTKELYTFNGWYHGNTQVQSGKWKIADDTELTARWTRTTYQMSFDTAGGDPVEAMTVPSFSTVETLPTPTRLEHVFLGWFLDDNLVELPYEFTEGNLTLVAHWKGVTEDFEFSISAGQAIITKYIGVESEVIVPTTISGGSLVTTIASEAFANNSDILSIKFPSSVVNFEYKAIFQCQNIQELVISGNANITLKYMFGNDIALVPTSLKTIYFAEGSTTYSGDLFNGLTDSFLYSVYLPASLKTTPADAFYNCINIWKCYVPEGVTALGSRTFCACDNLVYIDLPSSLTRVGMNCTINVPLLKYLVIPATVTSVDYAGLAATSTVLLFEATSKSFSSSAFSIYEDEMAIFYGFEEIKENSTFIYALCKVGSVKQAIIIMLVEGANSPASYPTEIDGYPVTYNHII